jgi:hypothetical protein
MVKWDMSGDWELMQSNGLIVKMTLVHHRDGPPKVAESPSLQKPLAIPPWVWPGSG